MRKRSVPVLLEKLVRIKVFARSLTSGHQPEVVSPQASWIGRSKDAVYEHGEGYTILINRINQGDMIGRGVSQAMSEAPEHEEEAKECACANKTEEIAVVATADTIVDPNAVMILSLDTVVADSAVMATGWPPYVARFAVFGWYVHSSIGGASRLDHGPLCQWLRYGERILSFRRG